MKKITSTLFSYRSYLTKNVVHSDSETLFTAQKTHNIREFCELIENNKDQEVPKFCITLWDSELNTIWGVARLYTKASPDKINAILYTTRNSGTKSKKNKEKFWIV